MENENWDDLTARFQAIEDALTWIIGNMLVGRTEENMIAAFQSFPLNDADLGVGIMSTERLRAIQLQTRMHKMRLLSMSSSVSGWPISEQELSDLI